MIFARMLSVTALIFCLNAAIAAAPPKKAPEVSSTKEATFVFKDKPQFELRLGANPSTGYSWFLKRYDKSLLQVKSTNYVTNTPVMPGTGGTDVWTFVANTAEMNAPIITEIEMVYARGFDLSTAESSVYKVILFNYKRPY